MAVTRFQLGVDASPSHHRQAYRFFFLGPSMFSPLNGPQLCIFLQMNQALIHSHSSLASLSPSLLDCWLRHSLWALHVMPVSFFPLTSALQESIRWQLMAGRAIIMRLCGLRIIARIRYVLVSLILDPLLSLRVVSKSSLSLCRSVYQ